MTGWFNIVGLLGIVASVAYGAAIFLNILLGLYGLNILGINFGDTNHVLSEQFLLFLIILARVHAGQHLRRPLPGCAQQHLGRLAPARGRDHHRASCGSCRIVTRAPSSSSPRSSTSRDSSAARPATSGSGSSSCRSGSCLTMYTETGYDASAHTAEETEGAAIECRPGRLALGVLLGDHRLDPAALVPVRGHRRRRGRRCRRLLDGHLHFGARFVGGQAGDPDRDRRSAVLRSRRSDQRVADLVRVLARPGDPGMDRVPPGEQRPCAIQRGDRRLVLLAGDLDPGAVREERRPVRVLRADRNLHGRPVRRLHHPGVPAAPGRRLVQARALDARREVQVGQHHRDPLRDPGRVRPRPAVHAGGPAVERAISTRAS